MEYVHIVHPFAPLYDRDSTTLILGSLPSAKSREQLFFYGHPQNRFWKVLAAVLGETEPGDIEQKRALILRHHLALWDTIYSCDIKGSSDSSIRNVVPTDLEKIVRQSKISRVFCNGQTSGKFFRRFQEKTLHIEATILPSTSPANAACSLTQLVQTWREALLKGRDL